MSGVQRELPSVQAVRKGSGSCADVLVEKFRGEVGPIRPDECVKFGVDSKKLELFRVLKRFKDRSVELGSQINFSLRPES